MFSKKDLTNIEGLMMLYAVKTYASKRHAAKSLNVSLDTMDKYLHILEDELGVKILTTSGRGCFLTPQGEKIIKSVDIIKKGIENLYLIKNSETEIKGEVRVAYDLNVKVNHHILVINYLFQEYPDINLCIDNISASPNMSNAEYDIYLSYQIPEGEDLVVICSKQIAFKFFASRKYLEQNKYPESIDDLVRHHNLVLRKDVWREIVQTGRVSSDSSKGVVLTNSAFVVSDVASNDCGIGLMPYYFDRFSKNLVCLNNINCDTYNTLYLISHKNRKDIPKVRVVLDYYKNLLKKL